MKLIFILLLLIAQINCIQNIMDCPGDVITLKQECKSALKRKKESEDMVILALAIASKGGLKFVGFGSDSNFDNSSSSSNSEYSSVTGITSEHNRLRALENANLPDLVWNPTVAAYALSKVTYLANNNNCTMSHTAGPTNPGYGENLAWASWSTYTAIEATNAWYNEKANYTYATNSCSGVCGHYTQVVWKKSTKIGCAGVVGPNNGGIIYGCNYNPPGNYSGQKPY